MVNNAEYNIIQCVPTTVSSLITAVLIISFLKINAEKGEYGLEPFSGYKGLHGFLPHGKKFDFPEKHQQAHQMDEMCRAIMEGKPSLTPGEEGLRDMIIIDAIKESIKKGGKKVML